MLLPALFVVASGFLNALWNLFAKQSLNKVVFLWSFQWVAVCIYLPWAIASLDSHAIPRIGWLCLLCSVSLHGFYVVALSRTYTLGDLSQVYPLMRGVGPLLVPLLGVLWLGERLSWVGWLGVASIVVGIAILGQWSQSISPGGSRVFFTHSARLALVVGIAITAYTTIDKVTLRYIPPIVLNDASNLGNLLSLSWWALSSRAIKVEWRAHWKSILLGGIISPGSYLLFLLGLSLAPLVRLGPMRSVGLVFATMMGIWVLKEPYGLRRMAAAALVAAGVILLGVFG